MHSKADQKRPFVYEMLSYTLLSQALIVNQADVYLSDYAEITGSLPCMHTQDIFLGTV